MGAPASFFPAKKRYFNVIYRLKRRKEKVPYLNVAVLPQRREGSQETHVRPSLFRRCGLLQLAALMQRAALKWICLFVGYSRQSFSRHLA